MNKGGVVFRQGQESNACMYDIAEGSVAIYTGYGTDQEKLLVTLRAKECFGEMGMLENQPRSATAVVQADDTELEIISESTFGSYLEENPEKVLAIMQHMSHRIRVLTTDYMHACRAVKEMAEAEETGQEKSSWFYDKLKKFSRDIERTV